MPPSVTINGAPGIVVGSERSDATREANRSPLRTAARSAIDRHARRHANVCGNSDLDDGDVRGRHQVCLVWRRARGRRAITSSNRRKSERIEVSKTSTCYDWFGEI